MSRTTSSGRRCLNYLLATIFLLTFEPQALQAQQGKKNGTSERPSPTSSQRKEEDKSDRKDANRKGQEKSEKGKGDEGKKGKSCKPWSVPPSMPGRVRVVRQAFGETVMTASRELLRGSAISVFKYRRDQLRQNNLADYIYDRDYYRSLKGVGINAIRLVAFDPWQRSHGDPSNGIPYPYADFLNPSDMADLIADIDAVVSIAASEGMYVMINYHDTGGYRDPDHSRIQPSGQFEYLPSTQLIEAFWSQIAPRYADTTHVFYELTNEPVAWHPNDYSGQNIEDFLRLYAQVRLLAPKSHIVLGSFATTASWRVDRTMLTIAQELELGGVDFDNASIGFHPYKIAETDAAGFDRWGRPILDITRPLLELMHAGYPVLNTEQNFRTGMIDTSDPNAPPLFPCDSTGVESMERLGVSWFHWNTTGPEEFENLQVLVEDAIENRYYWLRRKGIQRKGRDRD